MLALVLQAYVPLDETEFYLKGTKYSSESIHRVKAANPGTAAVPSSTIIRPICGRYNGGVTRIFVPNREEFIDAEVQKVLFLQLRDRIEVRLAHRDDLPAASGLGGRDTAASFDFAVFDDKLATEVFNLPGKYFGPKTWVPALIDNFQHLFALIEQGSHLGAVEEDRIVLAAMRCPAASAGLRLFKRFAFNHAGSDQG